MANLFLTSSDQVIDLDYVAAIEIDDPSTVRFHLRSGGVISSPHDGHEAAVSEKWEAFEKMKAEKTAATEC